MASTPSTTNNNSSNRSALVLIVCFIGLLLTAIATTALTRWERERDLNYVNAQMISANITLRSKIDAYIDLVNSVENFYNASTYIDREEFHIFTKPLLAQYAEIYAFQWIPKVTKESRETYISKAIASGVPDYKISSPLEKEISYPLYFIEPYDGSEKTLGIDLGSLSNNLSIFDQALKAGFVTSLLNQSSENKLAIIIPVYKTNQTPTEHQQKQHALLGYIRLLIDINRFVQTTLLPSNKIQLATILDKSHNGAEHKLFQSENGNSLISYNKTNNSVIPGLL